MSAMNKKTLQNSKELLPFREGTELLPCKELISWPPSQAGSSDSENVVAHEVSRGQEEKGTQNKTS